ncbi:hypothetical protein PVK06_036018 [Gossypium arboreum]|uniref:Uncharacterized protein n=1 Tax=Gossypium arboreum TaxID=29729 RepID=A0ABR0NIC7_GOSAR|nr:hypothetical protein PVK06_036018 [Gossypium arboreum]
MHAATEVVGELLCGQKGQRATHNRPLQLNLTQFKHRRQCLIALAPVCRRKSRVGSTELLTFKAFLSAIIIDFVLHLKAKMTSDHVAVFLVYVPHLHISGKAN